MGTLNKEELKELLNYHDNLYYNQDDPEISDEEYDAIKREYASKYGEYDYVPGEASDTFAKYTHSTNISSLDKLQISDEDGLRKELKRLWPVSIQPKFDGLTVVTYPDGQHVTRGNGTVGEVITENVKKVDGIGSSLDYPVRSEAVMLKSEFDRINEEREKAGLKRFKNRRNAAAGTLRNLDSSRVDGIVVFAYNLVYQEESNNIIEQLDELHEAGWNVSPTFVPESIDDAIEYIQTFDRESLNYDIDGLVVKHIGDKVFGATAHHPKNAVAIKFEAQGEWTKILDIVWQVGRTGKITPVAEFETIDLLGASVSRASLFNMGIMAALGLDHLCTIGKNGDLETQAYVVKANDVIPTIIEVSHPPVLTPNLYVKKVAEPSTCPACGGDVRKHNDQLYCTNNDCSARIIGRLVHMAHRDAFDIKNLSDETARKLVALYKKKVRKEISNLIMASKDIKEAPGYNLLLENTCNKLDSIHPSFIYTITEDEMESMEGFARKSAKNLYKSVQDSLTIDVDKFIYGSGMPLIGRKASKDIAYFYYNEEEPTIIAFAKDYVHKFKRLKSLHGIGDEMVNSLINNYESMLMPFGNFNFTVNDIAPKATKEDCHTFVITGEFEIKRKYIAAMIEEAGHKVAGSVSSNTDYLLAAPGEEGTSKYKKAASLDTVQIIHSIQELMELL